MCEHEYKVKMKTKQKKNIKIVCERSVLKSSGSNFFININISILKSLNYNNVNVVRYRQQKYT